VSPPDGGPTLATPIRHLIVLVFENRTFDNLFTGFPGADTVTTAKTHDGKTIKRPKAPDGELWSDIPHSHKAGLDAYAGGAMNGFDLLWKDHGAACASGKFASTNGYDPMSPFMAYEESQIPDLWAYGREFVLADKFFSTTLSNSEPGHFSIYAAQSPMIDNPRCNLTTACALGCQSKKGETEITLANAKTCGESVVSPACVAVPTVFDAFPAGLTWRSYAGTSNGVPQTPIALSKSLGTDPKEYDAHARDYKKLIGDIGAGDVANVSYVHVGGAYDGHPPDGMCFTQLYAVEVMNAIMKSPLWASSAVLVTWDDWGGFYDHVKPAADGCDTMGNHLHTGFRVPLLVVSPWARRAHDPQKPFVFHDTAEQASIPRLVEELFGGTTLKVGALAAKDSNARDAKAGSLLGAFDFKSGGDCSTLIRPAKTCLPPAAAACL
jgi:phospholipase C